MLKISFKFMIPILLVSFFWGCGDSGCINLGTNTTRNSNDEVINILDTKKETISYNEIKTLLENNETIYSKNILLDNKKTNIEISFDIKENNITEDITLDIEKIDYKKSVFVADVLKITSSQTSKDIDIKIVGGKNNSIQNVLKPSREFNTLENFSNFNLDFSTFHIDELIKSKPASIPIKTNFFELIKGFSLSFNKKSNQYQFNFSIKKDVKEIKEVLKLVVRRGQHVESYTLNNKNKFTEYKKKSEI